MKRTGEVILAIVGAVFYAFWIFIGGVTVWAQNNIEIIKEAMLDMQAETGISTTEINEMIELLETMPNVGLILAAAILAVVLGIVSMILLKGNKQPKAAGIILLATAVIFPIISSFSGIFAGIFYAIAGIMALVRKPKTIIDE